MPLRGFHDARRTRPSSLHHSPQARLLLARGASSSPTTTPSAASTTPAPLSCLSGNAAVFRPRHPHTRALLQYQQRDSQSGPRAATAPAGRKREEGLGRRDGKEGTPERPTAVVTTCASEDEGERARATPPVEAAEASGGVDLPINGRGCRSNSLSDFEIIHCIGNVVVSLDQDDSALSTAVAPTCAPFSEDDDDWELLAYDEEERDKVNLKAVPRLDSTTTIRGH
ncbi:hypothetical protein JCM21900_001086, partial [Sporobolomyces salmonicolor]